MSYLHVQWLPAAEIEAMNVKAKQTLNRYLSKLDRGDPGTPEVPRHSRGSTLNLPPRRSLTHHRTLGRQDGELDPTWTELERILDVREEEVTEVVDEHTPPPPVTRSDGPDNNNDDDGVVDLGTSSSAAAATTLTTAAPVRKSFSESGFRGGGGDGEAEKEANDAQMKTIASAFSATERCRHVLERVWDDGFSVGFVDPVDTEMYDDYLDVVDQPMCLRDVKEKLERGDYKGYNGHVKFANDVRLIWRNCKLYNLYRSQIWYTAHALSMLFERLFQGWVTSFIDGSIPITDPLGQPWESSCRACLYEGDDDQMILCDHCDAAFHTYCLKPKLAKVRVCCLSLPLTPHFRRTGQDGTAVASTRRHR